MADQQGHLLDVQNGRGEADQEAKDEGGPGQFGQELVHLKPRREIEIFQKGILS